MKYTLIELKARAWDVLAQIERLQNELNATNKAIREYKPEEPEELIEHGTSN